MDIFCQNGWPASSVRLPSWVRFTAGGRTWDAASPDVALVAGYAIDYFNEHVESIVALDTVFDDWSWSFRPIRGQITGYSNHSGACAWDLNATRHPRGVHGTFTKAQVATFDHLLNVVLTDNSGRSVLRWGEHYVTAPVDGMHIEIVASPAQVAQVAAKVRKIHEEEADMQWFEKVPLTELDAEVFNLTLVEGAVPFKKGDLVSYSVMLRYPPLARRLQVEMLSVQSDLAILGTNAAHGAAAIKALAAQVTILQASVNQIHSLLNPQPKTDNPTGA